VNSASIGDTPLLRAKEHTAPSVFRPENLLREARRQKQIPDLPVPAVCLLDPDGDVVRHLAGTGRGRLDPAWACYHTQMWTSDMAGVRIGVVGCAVGAPFAVLVAEQLAASGARLVVSITSAGQLTPLAEPPYFVLIDRALRDEGTSLHYESPGTWAHLPGHLAAALEDFVVPGGTGEPENPTGRVHRNRGTAGPWSRGIVLRGASWTTDAPYRETESAIAAAVDAGAVCVEMEAAALYAYAAARTRDVVCIAHITNSMAVDGDDFEKGEGNGAVASLALTAAIAHALAVD